MNKFILLSTFMFSTILIAQLQLDIQLKENLENDGNISKKNTIILTFTNNSDNDMVFPLNTDGIKPLFDGEDCIQKQKEFEINNAMPIINLKLNGKPVEFGRGLHHIDTNIPYDKPKTQNFYSSLIFIKAHQKFKYQLYFNPHEFYDNANEVFYCYYQTQKNIKYDLQIKFCINENVYKKLTKKQRKTLSNYKLYKGILHSNEINYNENIDYADDFIAK